MEAQTVSQDVLNIYKMLDPKPSELLVPGRKFLKEGAIQIYNAKQKKKKPRYFFLFNDVLLLVKKEGSKKYWLKVYISLRTGLRVQDVTDSTNIPSDVEFRIYSPKKTLICFAPLEKMKLEWLTVISECITECERLYSGNGGLTTVTTTVTTTTVTQGNLPPVVYQQQQIQPALISFDNTINANTTTQFQQPPAYVYQQPVYQTQQLFDPLNPHASVLVPQAQYTLGQPQPQLYQPYQPQPTVLMNPIPVSFDNPMQFTDVQHKALPTPPIDEFDELAKTRNQ